MSRVSLILQAGALKSYFPDSEISRYREGELTWVGTLTPSHISRGYKVRLVYARTEGVKFYVLEPKLELAPGAVSLPHVYSNADQRICLFTPLQGEWHEGMYFVRSIVPWASEWLSHYEVWAVTGDWNGGGTQPKPDSEKQDKNT